MRTGAWTAALMVALLGVPAAAQVPQGTGFTYQGRLTDAGTGANGPYDLQFALFATATGGSPLAPPVVRDDVAVTGGLFTVTLDFGARRRRT